MKGRKGTGHGCGLQILKGVNMEGFIWSRNPRWITGRNVLRFTIILMEKEDQFLYVRTFGIPNKIGYHVLTHLEEYKYNANSKHPYDSTLKGNGGIPTIKHTQAVIYIIGFTMSVGPKIQGPRTPWVR